jgi:hypothetical protein
VPRYPVPAPGEKEDASLVMRVAIYANRAAVGVGAWMTSTERRARAAIQDREVPRLGGLLGQGMRAGRSVIFLLLLAIAAVQVVIWLAFTLQGPTTGCSALDLPGAGSPLRPTLGSRSPRWIMLLATTPNSCLQYLLVKAPWSSLQLAAI